MDAQIAPSVRKFIADNFLYREGMSSFPDDASFLEAGLIDSTGVLELVAFLEKRFSIHVADAEVVPENLDSVSRITDYVQRKLDALTPKPAQSGSTPQTVGAAYAR